MEKNKYIKPNLEYKQMIYVLHLFTITTVCVVMAMIAGMILFSVALSFEFEEGALEMFAFCVIVNLIFAYPNYRAITKMLYINAAKRYSLIFEKMEVPFIDLEKIPLYGIDTYGVATNEMTSRKIKSIIGAIKCGYLVNCTLEYHDGKPFVALSKQVVKDKCPHCGAPIVGVYDAMYVCKYCGSRMFDVIDKK